jgi:hypothetical protein
MSMSTSCGAWGAWIATGTLLIAWCVMFVALRRSTRTIQTMSRQLIQLRVDLARQSAPPP